MTESRVFINGPTGSGKELVARQIHKQSSRSKKPFVVVNGALLDPQKYEQELSDSKNLLAENPDRELLELARQDIERLNKNLEKLAINALIRLNGFVA